MLTLKRIPPPKVEETFEIGGLTRSQLNLILDGLYSKEVDAGRLKLSSVLTEVNALRRNLLALRDINHVR